MHKIRAGIVLILTVCILAMTGCSEPAGNPTPDISGTPTASPTPTPAPEPTFTVTVMGGSGPVAGAPVTLVDLVTLQADSGRTDSDGRCDFPLPDSQSCWIHASADGYTEAAMTASAGEPAELTLSPAPTWPAWVMAFAVRDDAGYSHTYLAGSDDGDQWELLSPTPIDTIRMPESSSDQRFGYSDLGYEALLATGSPGILFRDGQPIVYIDDRMASFDTGSGQWTVRKLTQYALGWKQSGPADFVSYFGFFDFQVCPILDEGKVRLFGKNTAWYRYDALEIDDDYNEVCIMGWALEADRGAGYSFDCPPERYALITGKDLAGLREPCIVPDGDGWLMLATGNEGLYLLEAAGLTDAFTMSDRVPDGLLLAHQWEQERGFSQDYIPGSGLSGACLCAVPGTGRYRVYISFYLTGEILTAQTDLESPLTLDDFTPLIDVSILPDSQGVTFLGNPAIAANPGAPVTPPLSVTEPMDITPKDSEDARLSQMMVGLGTNSGGFGCDGGRSLTITKTGSSGDGTGYSVVCPIGIQQSFISHPAYSAHLTLPGVSDVMAGLVINWQEPPGFSCGGLGFLAGGDRWQLISFDGKLRDDPHPVLAEGALETPFTQGDLTVISAAGICFLYIDGQEIAAVPLGAVGDGAQPPMTGNVGVIACSGTDKSTCEFRALTVTDLSPR